MPTVRVTTDRYGQLTPSSQLTFGDVTVRVPLRGVSGSAAHRVWAAMAEVGVTSATDYWSDVRRYDDHITINVRPMKES